MPYHGMSAYLSGSLLLHMPIGEQFECLAAYLPFSTGFPYLLHPCIVVKLYLLLKPRGDAFDVIGNDSMIYNVWSTIQPRVIFNSEQRCRYIVLETLVAWAAPETQQGTTDGLGKDTGPGGAWRS